MTPVAICAQVTILGRHEADELLLLASDGLWDVLSNQEACRYLSDLSSLQLLHHR